MLVRQGGEDVSWKRLKKRLKTGFGKLEFVVALAGLGIVAVVAVGIYRIFHGLRKHDQDKAKGGEQAPHQG